MIQPSRAAGRAVVAGLLLAAASYAGVAAEQAAPSATSAPPGPSPAKQAVDARKAVYTLVGANFRPIGAILQGRAEYDAADIHKRIARLIFLSELARDAYPDVSNSGPPDTKAKAQIWTQRADFDKRHAEFEEHVKVLAQVNTRERGASEAFKAAAATVAQDCKGCHDNYREK